jgi:apurinic endonuclease APN1
VKRVIGVQIRDYISDNDVHNAMQFLGVPIGQIFFYPSLAKEGFKTLFFKNNPIYVHGSYRINLAQRSEFHPIIRKELTRMKDFGLKHYILHPGSWKEEHEQKSDALNRVSKMLTKFSHLYPDVHFIIENTPNKKALLGADIEDLNFLLHAIPKTVSLSFCIDTAHAFSAGYSIHTEKGLTQFAEQCTEFLSGMLSLIHLNDTHDECGSGKDQHEFPGKGILGIAFLKRFFSYKIFQSIPVIIEPPALSLVELKKFLIELYEILS